MIEREVPAVKYTCDWCENVALEEEGAGLPVGWIAGEVTRWSDTAGIDVTATFAACRPAHLRKAVEVALNTAEEEA